jgi:hypothetical protein
VPGVAELAMIDTKAKNESFKIPKEGSTTDNSGSGQKTMMRRSSSGAKGLSNESVSVDQSVDEMLPEKIL